MSNVTIGVLICMMALLLLHNHQPVIGLILFVAGFIIMNRKR